MIENRPTLNALTHVTLVIGIVIVIFPIYIAFVASTHEARDILMTVQGWFGTNFIENYTTALEKGKASTGSISVALMMWNSLIMALGIVVGKISISILSAYAIVYFRFPFRMFFFWMIFVTLMLPVEVRILPTYEVVANLGLLNTYPGLVLPLIASATATFLFRQFFLTIPDELAEAARVDGAGPFRFFFDILLPLSRTNIAALFVILFIYGWNQYLWPLLVTTEQNMTTIVMGIQAMLFVPDDINEWNITMATAILAMLPPVLIIIVMQLWRQRNSMVENRPLLTLFTHLFLMVGIVIVVFPIYIALVASTHEVQDILTTVQGWFGSAMFENYSTILISGKESARGIPVWMMMLNSLIMALGIVIGKISISIISAYAIVYFRFPFRMFFFWLIFVTLMLPVEVRILPTYEVVANLGLLNSYAGLILPLIASATATFLFRQFFLTIPDELAEAARVDGAGPFRFFFDILLPVCDSIHLWLESIPLAFTGYDR